MEAEVVECRSDSEYAERPLAFYWEGKRLEVDQVLARWRAPEGKGFRVRVAERGIFDLIYNEANDAWEVLQS